MRTSARVSMPLSHPVTVGQLPALVKTFAAQMAATSGQPVEILIAVSLTYTVDACRQKLPEVEIYYPVVTQ